MHSPAGGCHERLILNFPRAVRFAGRRTGNGLFCYTICWYLTNIWAQCLTMSFLPLPANSGNPEILMGIYGTPYLSKFQIYCCMQAYLYLFLMAMHRNIAWGESGCHRLALHDTQTVYLQKPKHKHDGPDTGVSFHAACAISLLHQPRYKVVNINASLPTPNSLPQADLIWDSFKVVHLTLNGYWRIQERR